MRHLIDATRQALADKNWYAALALALTFPDICQKATSPEMRSSKERYSVWYDRYLLPTYTRSIDAIGFTTVYMTALDCYALRCAYLHQGEFSTSEQSAKQALERFFFTASPDGTGGSHCSRFNEVLNLDVASFCNDVLRAVEQWLLDVESDPAIAERIARFGTIHEGSGVLVIVGEKTHIEARP
ncbi:hypothetical protein [Roseateles sp.]|uniref:hypothetical protein n=1 Tax=Roseateles sp. TaxID=1971397 RepID=UPI0031D4CFA1